MPDNNPGARDVSLFVYDGGCGFCTRWARWLAVRTGERVRFAPFQQLELDPLGLSEHDVQQASFLIDEAGRAHPGARGISAALRRARWPWSVVGTVLSLPILRGLAGAAYTLVARNRGRLPSPGS